MKLGLKLLFLVALIYSPSSFALEFMSCDAQVWEKPGDLKEGPALVSSTYNSLEASELGADRLLLVFKTETLKEGAGVILDGRYLPININARVTLKRSNDGVRVKIEDRVTWKTAQKVFYPHPRHGSTLSLKTRYASMDLTCYLY